MMMKRKLTYPEWIVIIGLIVLFDLMMMIFLK